MSYNGNDEPTSEYDEIDDELTRINTMDYSNTFFEPVVPDETPPQPDGKAPEPLQSLSTNLNQPKIW